MPKAAGAINWLRTTRIPTKVDTMSSFRFLAGICRRHGILAGILAVLLLAFGTRAQAPIGAASRKPCILLILADDLGCGDLGCYGQQKIKTPNLDKLAADGMRFTSFYAGSPLSAPSRTVLLTGKDTGHARNRGLEIVPLQLKDMTVAQVLKDANYSTMAVGKWGLGDIAPAARKGFDEWLGFLTEPESENYYPETLSRTSEHEDRILSNSLNLNGKKGRYADDFFCDFAQNFVYFHNPEDANYHRPWFAWVSFTIPYAGAESRPQSAVGAVVRSDAPYSDYAWTPAEKTRAAMITLLDSYVGRLLDKLQQLKNDKNTIVIFTSVTGPQHDAEIDPAFFNSTGSLRGFKHDLYEGGIRVPLIVRWPLEIRPGAVSDLPCAAWDILPTLAEAAHTSAPTNIDGISLMPALLGGVQTNRHDYLYWESHDHGFKQALRVDDWKGVRLGADGPLELYNLKDDPGEKTDAASQNPGVVEKLGSSLKTARTDDPNWPVTNAVAPPGGK
jgi:arylsulfatase A-like enzyme